MKSDSRACVAYIAAGLCGATSSYIYDYSKMTYRSINGNVDTNNINIFDYDRSCYVSGPPGNLYDYGNNAYINLSMSGPQFNGYDYHTGNHFNGNVNGRMISIYDYETSSYYNYSI